MGLSGLSGALSRFSVVSRAARRPLSDSSSCALQEWLRASGARHEALAIRTLGDERGTGVVALRAIDAGEVVLSVPWRCLMSVEDATASPAVSRALDAAKSLQLDGHEGNLALALLLVAAPHEDPAAATATTTTAAGRWAPYLRSLPRELAHLPSWWSDVELESLLKGTSLLEEVRASREEAVADWRALRPAWAAEYATHPLWAVSQDDGAREFKWAEASVRSRAFAFERGGKATRAMVPFADLLNTARHHERCVDFAFDDVTDCFVMRAVRCVREGEDVTDSYGVKSNARFLQSYGFCHEDNRDEKGLLRDDLAIDVALPVDCAGFEAKRARWLTADGAPSVLRARWSPSDDSPGELLRVLSMLRLAVATQDEVEELERTHFRRHCSPFGAGKHRPFLAARATLSALARVPALSAQHELRALDALHALVHTHLAHLDHHRADATTPNERHAGFYARGQKLCLAEVSASAKAASHAILHGEHHTPGTDHVPEQREAFIRNVLAGVSRAAAPGRQSLRATVTRGRWQKSAV